jgi:hypothetical protein
MKKTLRFSQLVLTLLLTVVAASAENPPATDPAYGAYPKDYKRIANRWLETHLVDPTSAVVEWLGDPKPADLPAKGGAPLRGYLVEFKVNSRNQFGAATGKQKHGLLIRDGEVIKAIGY